MGDAAEVEIDKNKRNIQDIQMSGSTVIVFDLAGQDFQNLESVNRIYADRDGIALKIFVYIRSKLGKKAM